MTSTRPQSTMESQSTIHVPRIAIRFCTQCKWNLRAAYYAQELLQTFATTIGEISLIPVTGGIFDITLYHIGQTGQYSNSTSSRPSSTVDDVDETTPVPPNSDATAQSIVNLTKSNLQSTLIWERKRDGGFPETKELKNRIRNIIDPQKDMGHIDRSLKKNVQSASSRADENVETNSHAIDESSTPHDGKQAEQGQAAGGARLQSRSTSTSARVNAITKECDDCK